MNAKNFPSAYVRNFVFGVEDSLVSTVGLLSGIAVAGTSRASILLTGIVLIFVEAFSMAVGSFLSESSAEEYSKGRAASFRNPFWGGMIMFVSYFVSGFIPLAPYVFMSHDIALPISIIVSLITLLVLGFIGGAVSRMNYIRSGLRMLLVGGIAALVGVIVGKAISGFI